MNRKIILLPLVLSATMILAGCNNTADTTTSHTGGLSVPSSESVSSEVVDTGIAAIKASGTYDISGVIGAVGASSFIVDDGKAAIYVYKTLDAAYAQGDYVTLKSATVVPYCAAWEVTKFDSMAKATGTAPTLATPKAVTSEIVAAWVAAPGAKTETEPPLATKDIQPYTLTAKAKLDGQYTYFLIDGVDTKLEPYNLNSSISFVTDVSYTVNFYPNGYNNYVKMIVASATGNFDPVASITASAPAGVTNVQVGDTVTLTAAILPATANPAVTWVSDDAASASIDAKSGVVTGVAIKDAVTFTATAVGDTSKTATVTLAVIAKKAAVDLPSGGLVIGEKTLQAASGTGTEWNSTSATSGSYPTADISVTIGGSTVTAVAGTLLIAGKYDPWKKTETTFDHNLMQLKKYATKTVGIKFGAAFNAAQTCTIELYTAGYATETGAAYFPTVQIDGTDATMTSPVASEGVYSGVDTGISYSYTSGTTTKSGNYYKYTLVYDLSSVNKSDVTISCPTGGASVFDTITLAN
jgi:hypothetical protein